MIAIGVCGPEVGVARLSNRIGSVECAMINLLFRFSLARANARMLLM